VRVRARVRMRPRDDYDQIKLVLCGVSPPPPVYRGFRGGGRGTPRLSNVARREMQSFASRRWMMRIRVLGRDLIA